MSIHALAKNKGGKPLQEEEKMPKDSESRVGNAAVTNGKRARTRSGTVCRNVGEMRAATLWVTHNQPRDSPTTHNSICKLTKNNNKTATKNT